jgi:hypothetical protein
MLTRKQLNKCVRIGRTVIPQESRGDEKLTNAEVWWEKDAKCIKFRFFDYNTSANTPKTVEIILTTHESMEADFHCPFRLQDLDEGLKGFKKDDVLKISSAGCGISITSQDYDKALLVEKDTSLIELPTSDVPGPDLQFKVDVAHMKQIIRPLVNYGGFDQSREPLCHTLFRVRFPDMNPPLVTMRSINGHCLFEGSRLIQPVKVPEGINEKDFDFYVPNPMLQGYKIALAGSNDTTKTFFNVKVNEENDQLIRIWVMSGDCSMDVVFTARVLSKFLTIRPLKEDGHFNTYHRQFEYTVERNEYLDGLDTLLDIQAPVLKEAHYNELAIMHHFNSSLTLKECNDLHFIGIHADNEYINHTDELTASYNHTYLTDFLRCYPKKTKFTLAPTQQRGPMFVTAQEYGPELWDDVLLVMPVIII